MACSARLRVSRGLWTSATASFDVFTSWKRISDLGLAFDLAHGEAAGNPARIIGAAFDGPALAQYPEWVSIGLHLFDGDFGASWTMPQMCALVAQIMGLNNTAFVTTVYTNVVGAAPSPAELGFFVGLLQGSGGPLTQGQLLEIAANAPLNEVNIDLVGLQQTGVEFV